MSDETVERNLLEIVLLFCRVHPQKAERLTRLHEFLADFPALTDQIRRSNMRGHITASAIILNQRRTHVLLIEHKTLQKKLPPGGHWEAGDRSAIGTALRETEEETGVLPDELKQLSDRCLPLDINTHAIPANKRKAETEHWHHDFRFLFQFTGIDDFPRRSPEDGGRIDWRALDSAFPEPDQADLATAIRKHLAHISSTQ